MPHACRSDAEARAAPLITERRRSIMHHHADAAICAGRVVPRDDMMRMLRALRCARFMFDARGVGY